jgi:hypothetical protein
MGFFNNLFSSQKKGNVQIEKSEKPSKAKSNEHYILKCKECNFIHHIPRDVVQGHLDFRVNIENIELICIYGGMFTVSLNVKEFFTISTAPSSGQVLHASIADNIKVLHNHILSHCDPLYLIINQSTHQTKHEYQRSPVGNTFVKFSKEKGMDIVGNIDLSKAEIPGTS